MGAGAIGGGARAGTPRLQLDFELVPRAVAYCQKLRARGSTPGTVDMIIGTDCFEMGAELLTADRDVEPMRDLGSWSGRLEHRQDSVGDQDAPISKYSSIARATALANLAMWASSARAFSSVGFDR
jgi:hypothetical protein